ncbi:MAG: ABC-F family ATP-binding cassette domain-containing protein [Bacteroidetes bacterium]|nr:ABC-F family ATP-binding cassette domain-containing protein [Bacteroidota bacterium]
MLALSEISVWFTGKALFDEASFLINKNDRIGLVGKNGAGKSTLLKIIAGLQEPEGGGIFKPNDITIGYLPQEMEHQDGRTVFDEALQAFKPLLELDAKIHVMGDEVAKGENVHSDAYMKLLDDLHEANDRFSMMGGYTMESDTEKILLGLGFNREDFPRITDTFSGGWRMRIELAKILLQKPDLLLLDEPTNHLDIESIQWLEGFLKDYPGAIVLVSHDRVFLDVITTRTIEINLGKFHDYNAPYSRYVEMRVERRTLQMASFENQQKMIEDTEKFIERFRYKASKAVQVQSRIKQLNKVDRIEIEEEDLSSIKFRFPDAPRSGKVVVATSHLTKIYPPKTILEDLEFEIERGDKVAFVGKNGEGKSTLSRIIAGIETYNGTLEFGHNTKIGFYAQNQAETLTGDKTVFQTIDDEAAGEMRTKVRSLLGAFLFGGDAIDKKVKVLSGGEKSRLSLAKLLLTPVNLLILKQKKRLLRRNQNSLILHI